MAAFRIKLVRPGEGEKVRIHKHHPTQPICPSADRSAPLASLLCCRSFPAEAAHRSPKVQTKEKKPNLKMRPKRDGEIMQRCGRRRFFRRRRRRSLHYGERVYRLNFPLSPFSDSYSYFPLAISKCATAVDRVYHRVDGHTSNLAHWTRYKPE